MSVKFYIYLFSSILVVWSLESLNINKFFKKNRVVQARILYLLIGLSLIYLVTNFIYDLFLSSQII